MADRTIADRTTLTPLPTEPAIAAVPGPVPIDLPPMHTALWAERMLLELLVQLLDHPEHRERALQVIALTNHPDNRAHARELIEAAIASGPGDTDDPLRAALERLDAQWCSNESSIGILEEIGSMQRLLAITLSQIYLGNVRSLVVCVAMPSGSARAYSAGAETPAQTVYALELAKARIVRDGLEHEDDLDEWAEQDAQEELEPEPA